MSARESGGMLANVDLLQGILPSGGDIHGDREIARTVRNGRTGLQVARPELNDSRGFRLKRERRFLGRTRQIKRLCRAPRENELRREIDVEPPVVVASVAADELHHQRLALPD